MYSQALSHDIIQETKTEERLCKGTFVVLMAKGVLCLHQGPV